MTQSKTRLAAYPSLGEQAGDIVTLMELLRNSYLAMTSKYLKLAQTHIQSILRRASPAYRLYKLAWVEFATYN